MKIEVYQNKEKTLLPESILSGRVSLYNGCLWSKNELSRYHKMKMLLETLPHYQHDQICVDSSKFCLYNFKNMK